MGDADKLLYGIVIAVVALVVVAFALVLRQQEPAYVEREDTPAAVVHNYILALRQQDHERAYGYVSPSLVGRPATVEDFVESMTRERWRFRLGDAATSFEVTDTEITGELAVVTVEETRFQEGGLFDSQQYREDLTFRLRPSNGSWKIVGGDAYWTSCWEDPDQEYCHQELPAPVEVYPAPVDEEVAP